MLATLGRPLPLRLIMRKRRKDKLHLEVAKLRDLVTTELGSVGGGVLAPPKYVIDACSRRSNDITNDGN